MWMIKEIEIYDICVCTLKFKYFILFALLLPKYVAHLTQMNDWFIFT